MVTGLGCKVRLGRDYVVSMRSRLALILCVETISLLSSYRVGVTCLETERGWLLQMGGIGLVLSRELTGRQDTALVML